MIMNSFVFIVNLAQQTSTEKIIDRLVSKLKEMRNMANNGNELKEKLKAKLREIFQFESEDLNFGTVTLLFNP